MVNQLEKEIQLERCVIEKDGTVNCLIKKQKFTEMQRMNVKPKRVIFEVE